MDWVFKEDEEVMACDGGFEFKWKWGNLLVEDQIRWRRAGLLDALQWWKTGWKPSSKDRIQIERAGTAHGSCKRQTSEKQIK